MEWIARKESLNSGSVNGLAPVVESFLEVRGCKTPEQTQQLFDFSLKQLTDPNKLLGMDKAVKRLVKAFEEQESICIYGDFDMDGTPAVALLMRGFKALGFKSLHRIQPDRHKDGYGLHSRLLQQFVDNNGLSLVVTVDVGITDVAAVQELSKMGVETIITDHHQAKEEVPNAVTIVNPNQPGCESGLGYLCGTGVAFYLVMALKRELQKQGLLTQDVPLKDLLDCFAIGTVSDMVPLIDDNRILAKHGLKVLEKTSMVGIAKLMKVLNLSAKNLGAQDVGIRLAPKLNSLTRMECELDPIELFMVEEEVQAQSLVEFVMLNNKTRVDLMRELETLAFEQAKEFADDDCIFLWSDKFHKGLVGLLATKLCQKYRKPCYVAAVLAGGKVVGSARAPDVEEGEEVSVLAGLKACEDHLVRFGGHPAAAGFEVEEEKALGLRASLNKYFSDKNETLNSVLSSAETSMTAKTYYDFQVSMEELKQFMRFSGKLEPFGFDFEPPLFAMRQVKNGAVKELKGGHLRIDFVERTQKLQGLWFFPEDEAIVQQLNEEPRYWDILFEPQWNEFMGAKSLQMLIKQIRPSEVH